MTKAARYVLSAKADEDVEEIYDYTLERHGRAQTRRYLAGLNDLMITLAGQPSLGRERGEIREGLLSFKYEKHIVFYRSLDDHICVVRVLHGSRDLPRYFD